MLLVYVVYRALVATVGQLDVTGAQRKKRAPSLGTQTLPLRGHPIAYSSVRGTSSLPVIRKPRREEIPPPTHRTIATGEQSKEPYFGGGGKLPHHERSCLPLLSSRRNTRFQDSCCSAVSSLNQQWTELSASMILNTYPQVGKRWLPREVWLVTYKIVDGELIIPCSSPIIPAHPLLMPNHPHPHSSPLIPCSTPIIPHHPCPSPAHPHSSRSSNAHPKSSQLIPCSRARFRVWTGPSVSAALLPLGFF